LEKISWLAEESESFLPALQVANLHKKKQTQASLLMVELRV